jgi:hypothetical protein
MVLAPLLFPPAVAARVPYIDLKELVRTADFIGVVRISRVSSRIPLLRRSRAKATIIESWKGPTTGVVDFVAGPTWTCDISTAVAGEEAVIFVRGHSLLHSGRGRMPITTRDGRWLAAVWPDVRLPKDIKTEEGPDPAYAFIRSVAVTDLRASVARLQHDEERSGLTTR